jgi:hypothetical protein
MAKSPAADTLGIHLRNEIIEEIERRAAALDKKKGTYAGLILEKWFADGCPPVTKADELIQLTRQSQQPKTIRSAREIDPWNLDPNTAYVLVEDPVVNAIMAKLGVPQLFAAFVTRTDFETFATFDNHPTHWITLTLIKGYGNKRDDGLVFEAYPKGTTPRHEVEKKFREHAAKIGAEIRGPVKFSQLPERHIKL